MKNPEPYKMSKLDEYRLWVAIHDQENNLTPAAKNEPPPSRPSTEAENSAAEKSV